jgi:3-hydroxybutyryl-CoA dehydrogenase
VEVIQARDSDPAHVERVREFLAAIGKAPAVVRPAVGFVANRLQMALFCEAVRCLAEGLAGVEEIDEVARSSFGFRLPFFGPFQIADMAGLDVYQAVLESHAEAYGERFRPGDRLDRLVAGGRTGTSGGAGFYRYQGDGRDLFVERDRRYAALARLLEAHPPQRFTPDEEAG